MDFTTLDRAKVATRNTSSDNDALLALLITSVSKRMENSMLRYAQQLERTEVYRLISNYRTITLKGSPVDLTKPFDVITSQTRDFAVGVGLPYTKNLNYVVDEELGFLEFLTVPAAFVFGAQDIPLTPSFLQIKYTGGLATDTADLIARFPDLAGACDLQVAHLMLRRPSPGDTVTKIGGSVAQHDKQYQLLDDVREACDYWKRVVFS